VLSGWFGGLFKPVTDDPDQTFIFVGVQYQVVKDFLWRLSG
jgi:hypothetical protein